MKNIFKTDKGIILIYCLIAALAIGLSFLGFIGNGPFSFFPFVVTSISFVFGFFYFLLMLFASKKVVEVNDSNKNIILMQQMLYNLSKFLLIALGVVASFLFIYFCDVGVDKPKWVFALLLISGLPMILSILLFIIRGAEND